MPTLTVSLKDLESLVGTKLPCNRNELDEIFQYAKAEIEELDGNKILLEVEDQNRPDLWCAEGIARELRGSLGIKKGLKSFKAAKSNLVVKATTDVEKVRPFIACSAVKGCKLSDWLIKQLMQQQEKIDSSYGVKRSKTSIGLYKLDKINFPIYYTLTRPDSNPFVPLEFDRKLTPREILAQHPKGRKYGRLIKDFDRWPILLDSSEKVLSLPPIINSKSIGEIEPSTRNVFIEVTGTDKRAVKHVVKLMSLSLADRGGKIYKVRIDRYGKSDWTPDLTPAKFYLSIQKANKILGLSLSAKEASDLLRKARYGIEEIKKDRIKLLAPTYRSDLMHPVDIIEDLAIQYGYQQLKPIQPKIYSEGKLSRHESFSNKCRELLIGFGGQETMSMLLTSREKNFDWMCIDGNAVRVVNPISASYEILRTWLLPSLLEVLQANKHRLYPQKIFELGDCVCPDPSKNVRSRSERKLAYAISHPKADFTEIKGIAEAIGRWLKGFDFKRAKHPSFIKGRQGKIFAKGMDVGIFGEISPQVLEKWKLEMPVAALELNLSKLEEA